MARIQQIKHPDGDVIYPISHTNAIIDDSGNRLENVLQDLKLNSSIWTAREDAGLTSLGANREIILGSHLSIGDSGTFVSIGTGGIDIERPKGYSLISISANIKISSGVTIGSNVEIGNNGITVMVNSSNMLRIGSNVTICENSEALHISSAGIELYNRFDNDDPNKIHIGSGAYIDNITLKKGVYIQENFDTRHYIDSNNKLIPSKIPIDSSLKNSSYLAVNIEPQSNGNIKIGDTLFMPATPSGDPLHYAYETAGAKYNGTNDFIVKDAPWKDMVDTIEDKAKWGFDVVDASQVKQMTIKGTTYNYVQTTRQSPEGTTEPRYFLVGQASDGTWVEDETKVLHLPGHWYLNGLGDITHKELALIYENYHIVKDLARIRTLQITNIRTFFPLKNSTLYSQFNTSTLQGFYYSKAIEAVCILGGIPLYNTEYPHDRAPSINDEYGFVNNVVLKYLPQHRIIKTNAQTYKSSTNLHVVPVVASQVSLYFSDIIQVSKNSILYVINNAVPTTPITITLHPYRYAQLAEDADIIAALEAKNAALEGTGGSISLVSA